MKKDTANKLTSVTSQAEVVTLALYRLGGAQRAIDTEDVAVEAHKVAPGRFSWKKYPEQINLELVRVFLSDSKLKNGFINGSGKTGWRLTQRGLEWAEAADGAMKGADVSRPRAQSKSGSVDEQRWRRERARVLATRAWAKWAHGDRDIPLAEAKEVFRVDSYATGALLESKITRLRALFTTDDEVRPFLEHLAPMLN